MTQSQLSSMQDHDLKNSADLERQSTENRRPWITSSFSLWTRVQRARPAAFLPQITGVLDAGVEFRILSAGPERLLNAGFQESPCKTRTGHNTQEGHVDCSLVGIG